MWSRCPTCSRRTFRSRECGPCLEERLDAVTIAALNRAYVSRRVTPPSPSFFGWRPWRELGA